MCGASRDGTGGFLDFFWIVRRRRRVRKQISSWWYTSSYRVHRDDVYGQYHQYHLARSHFANRGVGGSSPSPTRPPPPAAEDDAERVNSSANARAALPNASARNPPAVSPPSRFATEASVPFDANARAARSKNFAADAAAASSSVPRNGHASPNAADDDVHDNDVDHVEDAPNARSGPPSSRNVSVVRSNSSSGLGTRARSSVRALETLETSANG